MAFALLLGDVEDLFLGLQADDIEARCAAAAELRRLLPEIEPRVRERLADPDPEVRGRCLELLLPRPGPAVAKIAYADPAKRQFAADLRPRDGAQAGLEFDLTRGRRRIGRVVVREALAWGCWVDLAEGEAPLRGDTLHPR